MFTAMTQQLRLPKVDTSKNGPLHNLAPARDESGYKLLRINPTTQVLVPPHKHNAQYADEVRQRFNMRHTVDTTHKVQRLTNEALTAHMDAGDSPEHIAAVYDYALSTVKKKMRELKKLNLKKVKEKEKKGG